ncbi:MAG: alpha/beta hydrolase [Pseudomonadota bacterium]
MPAEIKIRRAHPIGATISQTIMHDGWPLRTFDWPVTGDVRGSILFQGGRGDFIEKYLESFADWHAQGWSIAAFDWRGQGKSGRLCDDANVGHIDDFAVWIDDLAEFFKRWKATSPGPHIVIGHSMGGHLIMRALVEARIAPDAAVFIAPMFGIETPPVPLGVARFLFSGLSKIGLSKRPAWKGNERPAAPWASRQRFLTHDADRYADETWWTEKDPGLVLGPPSFGWLAAAIASTRGTEAPGALEGVAVPILILGTEGDRLVSRAAIRRFAARLSGAEFHMYDASAAHEILRERDEVRDDVLGRIAAFLGKVVSLR